VLEARRRLGRTAGQTRCLLALGLAGSLYTARRIAHRRYLTPARRRSTLVPFAALIMVLGALNVVMFLFPMTHRR